MKDIVNIVIADDNKGLIELMKFYISKDTKFNVIEITEDKESEIKAINKMKPHLVITDIKRGRQWIGLEIIEQYKNTEYKPIFMVVSASVMDYYEKIKELEIKYFLVKPYTEQEFINMLNNIYNDIFPKQVILKEKNNIKKNGINQIIKFFKTIKNE